MKKIFIALSLFFVVVCFAGCAESKQKEEKKEYSVEQINQDLLDAASQLEKSEQLYFDNGLEISGLGVTYDGRPTEFDGCYYWPAIEKMTNAHVDIDWHDAEGYSSSVATTLLMDISQLPDIVNPFSFGIMDLADDGLIVPLDDYLELMPDIVAAVGEERMDNWRQADGHIYYIPTVSSIQGSQSMMVRQDWLDELNMDVPETWEDWLALWRGIRDNDLNGNGDSEDEIPLALSYGEDGERAMTLLMNAFGIRASADCQFCVLDDGTYTMVYEHPKYEEFLQAVSDLYKEGIIKDDFNTYDYNKIEEMMKENLLGTTMTWAVSSSNAEYLRENGDADALWVATAPVQGPDGNQMIQERELISSSWCITARAKEEEKVEDIVRFFNWCFTQEGAYLYNYGIEGVSYEMVEDKPVLNADLIADSFTDYRAVGCNFEPFGGLWLEDAFMQCLFSGKTENELDEITAESFKGLFEVNDDYFYTQPVTFETNAYVKYRSNLITAGICPLRDQAIRGEITVEEFAQKYKELKEQGLNKVIKEAEAISKKN
ncbi:MAG: extracellular solute-binding protein [Anaerobutyricum sp.]|nr:extracellular solute-binding protein [Eubacterium sp.]MDY6045550.1 extracellular solute-binding protein [Anaerobutyricum sp.]